jgi:hypothetical protein
MSDVVEKTIGALPRLLTTTLFGGKGGGGEREGSPRQQPPVPRELQLLVKAVDNAKSRSQQAAVVGVVKAA